MSVDTCMATAFGGETLTLYSFILAMCLALAQAFKKALYQRCRMRQNAYGLDRQAHGHIDCIEKRYCSLLALKEIDLIFHMFVFVGVPVSKDV